MTTELDYYRKDQSFDWFNRKTININNKLDLEEIPIANNWLDDIRINSYVTPSQPSRRIIDVEELERQRVEEYGLKVDVHAEDIIKDLSEKMVTLTRKNEITGDRLTDPRTGETMTYDRTLLQVIRGEDTIELRQALQQQIFETELTLANNQRILQRDILNIAALTQQFALQLAHGGPGQMRPLDPALINRAGNIMGQQGAFFEQIPPVVSWTELTQFASTGLPQIDAVFGQLPPELAQGRRIFFLQTWMSNPNISLRLQGVSAEDLEAELFEKTKSRGERRPTQAESFSSAVGIGAFYRNLGIQDEAHIRELITSTENMVRSIVGKEYTRDIHIAIFKELVLISMAMTNNRIGDENKAFQEEYAVIERRHAYSEGRDITNINLKTIYKIMLNVAKEEFKKIGSEEIITTEEVIPKAEEQKAPPETGEQNMIEDINKILDNNNKTDTDYKIGTNQFIGGTNLTKMLFSGTTAVFKLNTLNKILKYMQDNQVHSSFFQGNDMKNKPLDLKNLTTSVSKGNKILIINNAQLAQLIKKSIWPSIKIRYTEFGSEF